MINYFRKNQQIFIVFIFFYCILLVLSAHLITSSGLNKKMPFQMPFLANHLNFLLTSRRSNIFPHILTIIGLLFVGFYLTRISVNYLIIQRRTQLPALFLISNSSFAFHGELFSGAIIASIFILLAMDRLFGSIDKQSPSLRFFDAGIILAFGSLFYFNIVF